MRRAGADFSSFYRWLQRMARWLQEMGVKTVAMESTGVYWVPVYEILEDHGMEVVLANARQARAVPGRRGVVGDPRGRHRLPPGGCLHPSFRPGGQTAALRPSLLLRKCH